MQDASDFSLDFHDYVVIKKDILNQAWHKAIFISNTWMNVHEINLFNFFFFFHLPGAGQSFPDENLINSGKKLKQFQQ